MAEGNPKDLFKESLERCSQNDRFIPSFYQRFLASSDEVRDKFAETDFEKQNEMLLKSLRLSAGATSGDPDSLREMRERAESHDRKHLDIKPHLYDLWRNSILATASDYDPEWSAETESAWKTILGHVIDHMVRYY